MTATAPPALATLPLADDALVLSHRLGEWAGHAPVLEEELALANIALDLLGQARSLYAGLREELGTEDEIAYLREEREFRNCQLAEQPNGDFAHTIVRQLFFSTYQQPLYTQLAPALPLAEKAVRETAYHRDHAEQWTLRLGDGTEESHARTQRAADALWRFTGELFQPVEGLEVRWEELEEEWSAGIADVFSRAGLTVPEGPRVGAWTAGAGRQGLHTEPFGRMLAEMQHLHRSHPGATW
ncbi:phenylacetate-CoA oxygenase subunit PaaC [Streptomyces sp. NBC_01795]|uniref:1,2-phenylacetyl-CoA epoxidase subunit PaaC n=1 Tax=unclassified Streptomyces TaxID=2593676 RepID=UPI002DD856AB|nr:MULTISPECIES: 1,2-phenylacetyl-CoA epoxidase subunit PaaC [unclassified Streptomyces]WSA93587.1 phenylacetate-CoA oxygenase subunit PaaC [Streptomyces sp. NBC_01795]WSB77958.1 phenylacetate-CoA oxygenase subunit PaaC [Streptomyces sp. NBC_01775]WSS13787.1 phenylacetate-CoA oxygenase subunit PaaC [Streptomyces sp. NBC_01186]